MTPTSRDGTGREADTFDYLVLGGGSAGCVLAGRLSEDPSIRVGLVEAGGGGGSWFVRLPVGAWAMIPTRINNWGFDTVPQPGLDGRRGYQPRGRGLGGSSAINAMVYIRGHRSDYDGWAAAGATGWSYDEVLPYFRLSESNARLTDRYHGQDGPLRVSDLRTDNPFHQRFLSAAREAGFPLNTDFNGAEQEGLGTYQVTQHEGERWSAARGYLLPYIGQRPNLAVRTRTRVLRILFEGRRAVGAEVLQAGQRRVLHARREVLLAGGALQSPQLLMLSGVGPAADLQALGIPVVHDAPGVGRDLQDHTDFIFGYRSPSLDTLGLSFAGIARALRELGLFRRERRGMLTSNFAECGGFIRSRPDLPAPDLQLHFVTGLVDDHARRIRLGHGLSCHVCLLRPASRGSIGLASADPLAAPRIDPAFFSVPADLEGMVTGFKVARRLLRAPSLARWLERDLFTAGVEDDEAIRQVLRRRCDTVYHPVGTCRMGGDAGSVVDPQLRVRGVEALRVIDASVMPTLVGGNTNAPTVMIAEKAVDLLRGRPRVGAAERPTTETTT